MIFKLSIIYRVCRIQKDLVDSEKVQATLADEHLNSCCDLKRAIGTAALLEAQMREMNPNLDSISEYVLSLFLVENYADLVYILRSCSNCLNLIGTKGRSHCIMKEWRI